MRKSDLNARFLTGFNSIHTLIFLQIRRDKRAFSIIAPLNLLANFLSSDSAMICALIKMVAKKFFS